MVTRCPIGPIAATFGQSKSQYTSSRVIQMRLWLISIQSCCKYTSRSILKLIPSLIVEFAITSPMHNINSICATIPYRPIIFELFELVCRIRLISFFTLLLFLFVQMTAGCVHFACSDGVKMFRGNYVEDFLEVFKTSHSFNLVILIGYTTSYGTNHRCSNFSDFPTFH